MPQNMGAEVNAAHVAQMGRFCRSVQRAEKSFAGPACGRWYTRARAEESLACTRDKRVATAHADSAARGRPCAAPRKVPGSSNHSGISIIIIVIIIIIIMRVGGPSLQGGEFADVESVHGAEGYAETRAVAVSAILPLGDGGKRICTARQEDTR